ncbi:MAG: ATP-binding protein, partial [Elusimicrobiaceae bacterium]|nr:ATP-binding protein [Elusimicrobiaceae bacterium]
PEEKEEPKKNDEILLNTDIQIPYLDIDGDKKEEVKKEEKTDEAPAKPVESISEITNRIKSKSKEQTNPHFEEEVVEPTPSEEKPEEKEPEPTSDDILDDILQGDINIKPRKRLNLDKNLKSEEEPEKQEQEPEEEKDEQKKEEEEKPITTPAINKKGELSGFGVMEDSMLAEELENTSLSNNPSKQEQTKQETHIKDRMFKEILDQTEATRTSSEVDSLADEITSTNTNEQGKSLTSPPKPTLENTKTENKLEKKEEELAEVTLTEEPPTMPPAPKAPPEVTKKLEEDTDNKKEEILDEEEKIKEKKIPPPPIKPPMPTTTTGEEEPEKDKKTETQEDYDILNKDLPSENTKQTMSFKKKPASPADMDKEYQSIELPEDAKDEDHNCPIEMPLIPTLTFDNMVIGTNRFAHATTMTVIDSLGKMYNPLFLYGSNGTGKTHFINAIAYEISKTIGLDKILITNGVRFSRGIQRYVTENRIEELETFLQSMQALLIDDVHLMAVNKQNKDLISKWLNHFVKEKKQIVLTSKYPPANLHKLEGLIKFNFNNGWTSQLKYPSESNFKNIIKKQLESAKVVFGDENDIKNYFDSSLSKASRIINRVKTLYNLIGKKDEDLDAKKFLELILAKEGEDEESAIVKETITNAKSITKTGNGEWGKIGFFYPYGKSEQMKWMIYALDKRAKELKIPGGFEVGLKSAYKTDNFISSAFKIANVCDDKNLKGAVILGPPEDICKGTVKGNFYDILTHMLEVMLIRCGIINYENLKAPSSYTKVLTEMLK